MKHHVEAAARDDANRDVAAITQLYEDWKGPWESGDAFESDIIGKDAFELSVRSFFAEFNMRGNSSEIQEVEVAGDLAFARGTYEITVVPKNGDKPAQNSCKFVHVFKRQEDGRWKIYRAIRADD